MASKKTEPRVCQQCGRSFVAAKDVVKRGDARFCTRRCMYDSWTRPTVNFWKHVRKGGSCWEWTGYRMDKGYGIAWDGKKRWLAHRYSYTMVHGDPGDKLICHKCDNPRCVRPDHLFIGTQADNMKDAATKDRVAHGDRHSKAKLTSKSAATIVSAVLSGTPQRQVAFRHGVSPATVCLIMQGKIWSRATSSVRQKGTRSSRRT